MAISDKVVGMVLETKDYSKFRKLDGNRPVLDRRKMKVLKSVEENGKLFSPIIVNEKWEIIDGQARFEVFKEKGMSIDYIMKEGLGLKDCIVFNSSSTSWTLKDYIDSYASQGNADYLRMKTLIESHRQIPLASIMFAVYGSLGNEKHSNDEIKNGRISISEAAFLKADNLLTYAEKFLPDFREGNKCYFATSVMFAHQVDGIDTEKLLDKWIKYGKTKSVSTPATSIYESVGILERAYNYKSQPNSVIYLQTEYDKYCREQSNSYAKRWSEKRKK